eukprot:5202092-Pyramimonas_sp.AAC.1
MQQVIDGAKELEAIQAEMVDIMVGALSSKFVSPVPHWPWRFTLSFSDLVTELVKDVMVHAVLRMNETDPIEIALRRQCGAEAEGEMRSFLKKQPRREKGGARAAPAAPGGRELEAGPQGRKGVGPLPGPRDMDHL